MRECKTCDEHNWRNFEIESECIYTDGDGNYWKQILGVCRECGDLLAKAYDWNITDEDFKRLNIYTDDDYAVRVY